MSKYLYKTHGTCSRAIAFEIENDKIVNVKFEGGCNGNTQAISVLVKGMPVKEAIEKLSGIRCGSKETSCPDQFATALTDAIKK